MAASPPGQWTPSPSATKNRPNALSRTPTPHLSSVSGTRVSGLRSQAPAARTPTAASAAPASAGAGPLGRAASAATMRTSSTPSSNTPLNATSRPAQSGRPGGGSGASCSASWVSMNSDNEEERDLRPARRSVPLRSHSRPKSSSSAPIVTRSASSGTDARTTGPTTTASTVHAATAQAVPISASRQRRLTPTASTMASASSSSTLTATAAPIATSTKVSTVRPSWLRVFEDRGGVARERGCGVAQRLCRRGCARRPVDVESLDALVPALELVELGFLLVELGERELLDLELVVDLGKELRALAGQLAVLLVARLVPRLE